jgi:hypothetical protein
LAINLVEFPGREISAQRCTDSIDKNSVAASGEKLKSHSFAAA